MTKNHHYKYLFGPVPSRRLGISLGVDLVPHKTCSLNCIYCESGSTTKLSTERNEYVPTEIIISELDQFLATSPELDYITFSGSGEPTLHSGIGEIVNFIKKKFPEYKLALISNGTLFWQPGLVEEILPVDLILPSLDAASDKIFKKINKPERGICVKKIIEGLISLRQRYSGKIWLEIFIVPGINDTEDEIALLRNAVFHIKPDLVQINTLDRPGVLEWVKPASKELLEKIAIELDWQCEIIAKFKNREKIKSYRADIENTILQLIKRRPCTADDLVETLGLNLLEINKYIDSLLTRKIIETDKLARGEFFKIKNEVV